MQFLFDKIQNTQLIASDILYLSPKQLEILTVHTFTEVNISAFKIIIKHVLSSNMIDYDIVNVLGRLHDAVLTMNRQHAFLMQRFLQATSNGCTSFESNVIYNLLELDRQLETTKILTNISTITGFSDFAQKIFTIATTKNTIYYADIAKVLVDYLKNIELEQWFFSQCNNPGKVTPLTRELVSMALDRSHDWDYSKCLDSAIQAGNHILIEVLLNSPKVNVTSASKHLNTCKNPITIRMLLSDERIAINDAQLTGMWDATYEERIYEAIYDSCPALQPNLSESIYYPNMFRRFISDSRIGPADIQGVLEKTLSFMHSNKYYGMSNGSIRYDFIFDMILNYSTISHYNIESMIKRIMNISPQLTIAYFNYVVELHYIPNMHVCKDIIDECKTLNYPYYVVTLIIKYLQRINATDSFFNDNDWGPRFKPEYITHPLCQQFISFDTPQNPFIWAMMHHRCDIAEILYKMFRFNPSMFDNLGLRAIGAKTTTTVQKRQTKHWILKFKSVYMKSLPFNPPTANHGFVVPHYAYKELYFSVKNAYAQYCKKKARAKSTAIRDELFDAIASIP